jgi:hypothetical protein
MRLPKFLPRHGNPTNAASDLLPDERGVNVNEAWRETIRQTLMVLSLRQVECGRTTHQFGDCSWCGARL